MFQKTQPICRIQKPLKYIKVLRGGTTKRGFVRTGSTVTLSVLPVHIAITQTRPHLQSAVCWSTQFVTYTNSKQLSMICLLQSALLKVNCAVEYIWHWNSGNVLCTSESSGDWQLHSGTAVTCECRAVPQDSLNVFKKQSRYRPGLALRVPEI